MKIHWFEFFESSKYIKDIHDINIIEIKLVSLNGKNIIDVSKKPGDKVYMAVALEISLNPNTSKARYISSRPNKGLGFNNLEYRNFRIIIDPEEEKWQYINASKVLNWPKRFMVTRDVYRLIIDKAGSILK